MTVKTTLVDEIIVGIEASELKHIRIHVNMEGMQRFRAENDSIVSPKFIMGYPIYLDGTIFANDVVPWRICENDPVATSLEQERWVCELTTIARRWRNCDTPADKSKAEALDLAVMEIGR